MADIDELLNQHLIDTFKALPDREMYGRQYQNVPFESWKGGMGLASFDPKAGKAPNSDFLSTDENGRMLLWRLRQFLGS